MSYIEIHMFSHMTLTGSACRLPPRCRERSWGLLGAPQETSAAAPGTATAAPGTRISWGPSMGKQLENIWENMKFTVILYDLLIFPYVFLLYMLFYIYIWIHGKRVKIWYTDYTGIYINIYICVCVDKGDISDKHGDKMRILDILGIEWGNAFGIQPTWEVQLEWEKCIWMYWKSLRIVDLVVVSSLENLNNWCLM